MSNSTSDNDPPGCPLPAAPIIRTRLTRIRRAMRFSSSTEGAVRSVIFLPLLRRYFAYLPPPAEDVEPALLPCAQQPRLLALCAQYIFLGPSENEPIEWQAFSAESAPRERMHSRDHFPPRPRQVSDLRFC